MRIFGLIIGLLFIIVIKVFSTQNILVETDLSDTIYEFSMDDISGNNFDFSSLKGQVVLIVNVASKCGFTSQYKGLQTLYDQYKAKGFTIIGIPSNNFGNQEPGSNQEIADFCNLKFNVSFPMMSKVDVKGNDIHPLYSFLTDKSKHPSTGGRISWNFNKILINKEGVPVKRYRSFNQPMSKKIQKDIQFYLNQE